MPNTKLKHQPKASNGVNTTFPVQDLSLYTYNYALFLHAISTSKHSSISCQLHAIAECFKLLGVQQASNTIANRQQLEKFQSTQVHS